MGTVSKGTEGTIEEELQLKWLIGILPPLLVRWGEFFSESRNIQIGWKDYQGVIRNNYYGGHIETDHHVIWSMPEDVANHFMLPNFATPVP